MKIPIFNHTVLAAGLAFGFCAWSSAMADNMIMGLNRVTCLPKSDTFVSVPFMKQPLKATNTLGAPPNLATPDQAVLTPAQVTAWTPNELEGNYYLRFTSGFLAGHWYDISGNTASTVTIDLNGESGAGLAVGDGFIIVEYWTLDTLFPPGTQKTFHVSLGTRGYQKKSKILIPNIFDSGSKLPAKEIYFITADGWRQSTQGYPKAGDTIMPPGTPFIIRHPAGVVATDFVPLGEVLQSTDSILLAESKTGSQDNAVAVFRPVDLSLAELGLNDSSFKVSDSHLNRKDELLIFNNGIAGFNKKPSVIYYKISSAWYRDVGHSLPDFSEINEKSFSASSGIIIRKSKGSSDTETIWNNQPSY